MRAFFRGEYNLYPFTVSWPAEIVLLFAPARAGALCPVVY